MVLKLVCVEGGLIEGYVYLQSSKAIYLFTHAVLFEEF